jgi:methylenetetrahydrofolate reductase (NADPH)
MKSFKEIFSKDSGKIFSFEFFPPKSELELPTTLALIDTLSKLDPAFMTCTFRPDGTTQYLTEQIVEHIRVKLNLPAVSHLTCVGQSKSEIDSVLTSLANRGVNNILALRGDPPKDQPNFTVHPEGFACARDLVEHITERGGFSVAVAGYPEGHQEAESLEADLLYLKEKADAGAELIITQLFFDPEVYFNFVAKAKALGINIPILPGIMPIRDYKQLTRFTSLCGASIPKQIIQDLEAIASDSEAVINYGVNQATQLCKILLDGGAPGIHFYTLNKSSQVKDVVRGLKEYFN